MTHSFWSIHVVPYQLLPPHRTALSLSIGDPSIWKQFSRLFQPFSFTFQNFHPVFVSLEFKPLRIIKRGKKNPFPLHTHSLVSEFSLSLFTSQISAKFYHYFFTLLSVKGSPQNFSEIFHFLSPSRVFSSSKIGAKFCLTLEIFFFKSPLKRISSRFSLQLI